MKFSIQKSDGVTAVSEFLKQKTQSQYEITKEIKVIPNFINQDIYKKLDNNETKCLKEKFSPNGEMLGGQVTLNIWIVTFMINGACVHRTT